MARRRGRRRGKSCSVQRARIAGARTKKARGKALAKFMKCKKAGRKRRRRRR